MPDEGDSDTERIQATLRELGLNTEVVEFDASARSAADTAASIGCDVGQIAKSLLFRGTDSGKLVLVVASGANRVNPHKLNEHLGESVVRAPPDFVLAETGFASRSLPPVGHGRLVVTLLDEDLFQFSTIWAAAGAPATIFAVTAEELERVTEGEVIELKFD